MTTTQIIARLILGLFVIGFLAFIKAVLGLGGFVKVLGVFAVLLVAAVAIGWAILHL